MKKKSINSIYLIFILFLGLIISQNVNTVFASSQIPFQLQTIQPDNQISNNDYDDLLVKPNTSQELSFIIKNSDTSEQHFVVEANNAVTSDGIAVTYDEFGKNNLSSPMFTDLITSNHQQKITVPAKSEKTVTFNLKYPSEVFKGVILGGITVYLDGAIDNKQTNNNSFSITNRFTYSNAIQLRMERELSVKPNITANRVNMTTANSYPYVKINLSNNPRAIITRMSTENMIQNESGKTIETYNTSNGQVAPNSDFNLSIPLTNGALPPGKYRAIGKAVSGNYTWNWDKEFEVTAHESETVNSDSVIKPTVNYWIYLSLFLLVFIIILMTIIIFLIVKNRKKEEDTNEKN